MSDRDSRRAQKEALRAARAGDAGGSSRLHEDALARYLRLNAERPARQRQRHEKSEPPTDKESE